MGVRVWDIWCKGRPEEVEGWICGSGKGRGVPEGFEFQTLMGEESGSKVQNVGCALCAEDLLATEGCRGSDRNSWGGRMVTWLWHIYVHTCTHSRTQTTTHMQVSLR